MSPSSNKPGNAAEIDRLALALAKEPGSKAFIPLAEEYGKAGMWEEAAAVLEDGLKAYPSFITAMVALGRAYDQLNQPVKAKAILEEAVKLSPENLRAHRTLAKIYVAQGAKEAALRSCNVILSVNPQDQETLSLRAILGEPVAQPSTEPAKSLLSKRSGKPTCGLTASSGGAAPVRPVDQETQPESTTTTIEPSREDPAGAATHERSRAVAARLTEWLASIQARRRDGSRPAASKTTTS
jgi:tetratricopeptide (TPR) repeat protein